VSRPFRKTFSTIPLRAAARPCRRALRSPSMRSAKAVADYHVGVTLVSRASTLPMKLRKTL
jgi:hypothetical protein